MLQNLRKSENRLPIIVPFYTNIWPPRPPWTPPGGAFVSNVKVQHMARVHKKELLAQNALKAEEKWKSNTYNCTILHQFMTPPAPLNPPEGVFLSQCQASTYA